MPHISVPVRYTKGEKKKAYQEFWKWMMPHVATAIEDSLRTHPLRSASRTAIGERVNFAKRLVDGLRQEFKWSKWRIRDHISVILRARLSGISIPLERMAKRGSW